MKKLLISIGLVAVVAGFASVVYAASGTISLSPAAKNVSPGQSVAVTVTVNPNGETMYTAKAKIIYPADLLEVQSFTFSDGWLPLTQSGYDLTDNANGVLIKTAGYASGLSTAKALGTITFRVKGAGIAAITVASDSLLLDATNGNVFSSSSGSTLTSVQATPTPTSTPVIQGTVASPTPEASESPEAVAEESVAPTSEEETTEVAQAGRFLGLPTWISIAILVVVALVVLWLVRRRSRPEQIG